MISESDLYKGTHAVIKTQEQYPTSSGWPEDAKWILGEIVTVTNVSDSGFKVRGSGYYFPFSVILSIIDDDNCEIETGSIDSFIDLI